MADNLDTVMTPDCIFCRILAGELPSAEVYSDDLAYAFADISPVTPTHVLVIPRDCVTFIEGTSEAQEPLLGHLLRVGAKVARQCGIADRGYRLAVNQGADAGQMVDHLHVHVMGGGVMGKMA